MLYRRKKAKNDTLKSIFNENFTVVVMFGLEHKVRKSTNSPEIYENKITQNNSNFRKNTWQ